MRIRWFVLPVLMVLTALLAGLPGIHTVPVGAASQMLVDPPLDKFLYLPIISTPPAPTGRVTDKGAAAAGQKLALWYYNGSSFSKLATVTTNATGHYAFPFKDLPAVGGGKFLYVAWSNDQNDSHLLAWYCNDITGAASDKWICNIEISDVKLTDPLAKSINLPYTFRWDKRVPNTDSYALEFNYLNGSSFERRHLTSPLGYVGTWQMTSLPSNMNVGTQYYWGALVYGPNGYGASRYLQPVRFNDRSSPPLSESQAEDGALEPVLNELNERPR